MMFTLEIHMVFSGANGLAVHAGVRDVAVGRTILVQVSKVSERLHGPR